MSHPAIVQQAYTTITEHFVDTGRAPHYGELAELLGMDIIADPHHVLETVKDLRERGDRQLALHVVDLLALCVGDEPAVLEARTIKAEIAEELAGDASSFIAANLYRIMADYPHSRAID